MADTIIKFYSTTSEKLNTIEVNAGNLIFVKDERTIYLDTDVRTAYQQIICLANDIQRTSLSNPIKGFYFIEDTCILWRYDNGWYQLTSTPQDQIIFAPRSSFPAEGRENALYIDGTSMYRYIDGTYKLMNASIDWGAFA